MLKIFERIKNRKEADRMLKLAEKNLQMAVANIEVEHLWRQYSAACDDCLDKYYTLMGVCS